MDKLDTRTKEEFSIKGQQIVHWLAENSTAVITTDPRELVKDLNPLRNIVNDAQVVGLGEATHGNKEFAQIKDGVLRFLVEEMDFNGLVMEVPEESAKGINSYIKTGEGDPQKLLVDLGYWVTRTQEVLEMIIWMRAFNELHPNRKVSFYGCDISIDDTRRKNNSSRDNAMADNTIKFLRKAGENARFVLWAHNTHIANLDISSYKTAGAHLKDELGDKYLNFAKIFNQGSFLARREGFGAQLSGGIETFEFSNSSLKFRLFF